MAEPTPFLTPDQRLIQRIEELMANPPEGSVVLEITPALAKHCMGQWRGAHNRREKPKAIQRYAADMTKPDGWKLNGSTVVFTDQHLLGDGQNRMLACIRADQPFTTHLVFGVPHCFFDSMDQGRVRNGADLLHIEGVENSGIIHPAVRWAELLATGKVIGRGVFTSPQILDLYRKKHRGVSDWLKEAAAICRQYRQPRSIVAALLYTFDKVNPELAADFAAAWAGGPFERRFQAISTMQIEMERIRRLSNGRVHEVVRAAMIVNAWNLVRAGKVGTAASIRWELPTREKPTIFPIIQ